MEVKTVILGACCHAAGRLFSDPDAVIVARDAAVGAEFFTSYRDCGDWGQGLASPLARKLWDEFSVRSVSSGCCVDFHALAPLLYRELQTVSSRIMLNTEVTGIETVSDGFILQLCNPGGHFHIRCQQLIDSTLRCISRPSLFSSLVKSKKLNASILIDASAPKSFKGFSVRAGRRNDELFLGLELDPACGWTEGRERFVELFNAAGAPDAGASIASIAKEFDFDFNTSEHQIAPRHTWVNPLANSNPLRAFDAGISGR